MTSRQALAIVQGEIQRHTGEMAEALRIVSGIAANHLARRARREELRKARKDKVRR